jgi:hypothetical protein
MVNVLRFVLAIQDLNLAERNGVNRASDSRKLKDTKDIGLDTHKVHLEEGLWEIGDTSIVLQKIVKIEQTLKTGRVNAVDG